MNRIFTISILLLVSVLSAFSKAPKVLFPNGNEKLVVGSEVDIRWANPEGIDSVEILVSTDHTQYSKQKLVTGVAGNSYRWKVPKVITDKAKITIRPYNTIDRSSWAVSLSSNDIIEQESDRGRNIEVDKAGNVYLMGDINREMFIAKYGSDGEQLWYQTIGELSDNYVGYYEMTCDLEGNVYVAGGFRGKATFGNTVFINDSYLSDIFIAKYNTHGDVLWAKHIGSPNHELAYTITANERGEIFIVGSFQGSLDFDGEIISQEEYWNGTYIAHFTSEGNIVKVVKIDDQVTITDIAADKNNNFYISGRFLDHSLTLDTINLKGNFPYDVGFFAKYNPSGRVEWGRKVSSSTNSYGSEIRHIKIDKEGVIYICGYAAGDAYLGSHFIKSNGFIAKYNTTGVLLSVVKFKIPESVNGFLIDDSLNTYITHYFRDTITIAGISVSTQKKNYDVLIAKFNNQGRLLWLRQGGSTTAYEMPSDIAVDTCGNLYTIGSYTSGTKFDGDTLPLIRGMNDIFIWKIGIEDLQSDISDTTFSIVMPEATTVNVDMGMVPINQSRDSTINALITNSGQYPFTIDSVYISGEDATSFELLTNLDGRLLKPGGSYSAEFRFTPYKTQTQIAEIVMITQADTLYRSLIGKGLQGTSVANKAEFEIYPNPVADILRIENAEGIERMWITDTQGEQVIRSLEYQNIIDVSGLPAGVYFLYMETQSGTILEKLIKVD